MQGEHVTLNPSEMYILLQTFAQKDFQCMDLKFFLMIWFYEYPFITYYPCRTSQPTLIRPAGEIKIVWNFLDKELNALFSFILYYKINK